MLKFKTVKILGVEYKIIELPYVQINETAGEGTVGYCDDLDDKIILAKELKGRGQKKIFIHEWAHGVCGVNGLNQTLEPVIAESISQSFANALLELLEQKEVMAFLMKKADKQV